MVDSKALLLFTRFNDSEEKKILKITYEEWMSPGDINSNEHLDCDDDPPCPLRIDDKCAFLETSDDELIDHFLRACHQIALLRESSGFRLRSPSPDNRRRGARKGCDVEGDYRIDVDEGTAEEVRILNEKLGLETWSSCEGHLSENRNEIAYINCYIDEKNQSEIVNHLKALGGKSGKKSKNCIEFQLNTEDYLLSYVFSCF